MIPLCEPVFDGREWEYVKECIDSGWVSSVGSYVEKFEREFSEYLGGGYAVATVNGTAALHVALKVAGVEPGDEVLVSVLTFIAPVNAIRYCGAHPVFMDAEYTSWNMDPSKVCGFLREECSIRQGKLVNKVTGRRIAAILPVHILGHSVNLASILEVAKKYEIPVVEDAAESLGARHGENFVGTVGDIGCFSFNGNKIITSGGGGMIFTRDPRKAERAKHLSTQAKADDIEYLHDEVGYNYRLVNLLAAFGLAQLQCLPSFLESKQKIAQRYEVALNRVKGVTLQSEAPWGQATFWLNSILIDLEHFPLSKEKLIQEMIKSGVQVRPIWYPIHRQPMYMKEQAYRVEVAHDLHRRGICLPSSVNLSQADQDKVTNELQRLAEQVA